jgi:hypothetical protein
MKKVFKGWVGKELESRHLFDWAREEDSGVYVLEPWHVIHRDYPQSWHKHYLPAKRVIITVEVEE